VRAWDGVCPNKLNNRSKKQETVYFSLVQRKKTSLDIESQLQIQTSSLGPPSRLTFPQKFIFASLFEIHYVLTTSYPDNMHITQYVHRHASACADYTRSFEISSATQRTPPKHYCTALHFTALDGHGVPIASAVHKGKQLLLFLQNGVSVRIPGVQRVSVQLAGVEVNGGRARTTAACDHNINTTYRQYTFQQTRRH
jgi:hypothetical protein